MASWFAAQIYMESRTGEDGKKKVQFTPSATLNAPLKVAPGEPQSSKLRSKCKNKVKLWMDHSMLF